MWGALVGALLTAMGSLVGKVLISLGVGFAAYKGIDVSIAWAKSQFFGSVAGLPGVTIQLLGVMNVGTAVNILTSALVMRLTFKGMTGGIMKAAKLT